jgi:hypothetical protein
MTAATQRRVVAQTMQRGRKMGCTELFDFNFLWLYASPRISSIAHHGPFVDGRVSHNLVRLIVAALIRQDPAWQAIKLWH